MIDFLKNIFDTSDYPARWYCGDWSTAEGLLHIISDVAIWAAYFMIPIILVTVSLKMRIAPKIKVFLYLFGCFILFCGTTHLLDAIMFIHPMYRLLGLVKLCTAVVSFATMIYLATKLSWILSCSSPEDVERMNKEKTDALEFSNLALEKSNSELENFAYVASHDLKAPLRAIFNLSLWIQEEIKNPTPAVQEYLKLLQSRIQRMENLIDGMLEYSRIGRKETDKELVDLNSVVNDIANLQCDNFLIKRSNLPTVTFNKIRIEQVFINLLSNAIKHHDKESGTIEIGCEDQGNFYMIWVQDDGPGIAPQYHENIFMMFQTLKSKDEVEGSGMGLALTKKIIEDNGGKIWVESEEGQGAKFCLTISK